MFAEYHITMESFGETLPQNWEEIAAYLNSLIDEQLDQTEGAFDPTYDASGLSPDGHDIVNAIWERYCAGDLDGAPAPIL